MSPTNAITRLMDGLSGRGVDVSTWRAEFVTRRLRRAALLQGDVFVDGYIDRLLTEDAELEVFLSELSVGVSAFFRDALPFASLEARAVPAILRRTSSPRALCLGCAQGQEAWSVAMLFAERTDAWEVVGLDRHPGFVQSARRAKYPAEDVQAVTLGRARRFLQQEGEHFVVADALRPHVRFATWDLAKDDLPQWALDEPFDLVLARNFVIYLGAKSRSRLVEALLRCLAPEGFLLLGCADALPPVPGLRSVLDPAKLYQRRAA